MIKVGLIGYGKYGKKYYKNLLNDKSFQIVKILRKSKKNLNNLFTNNKENFFKIKDINLYIIASPTDTHYEYLKNTISKKKHIIIEKPIVSEFNQFLKIKKIIKNYKKIILINHTDLYMNAYLDFKNKLKEIGKIKSVKLIYGKIDPYAIDKVNNKLNLPHFEWLPHPLAIIIDLFKDQNYKLTTSEKRILTKKKLFQNLKIKFPNNKFDLEIIFSNNFRNKKRNLEIYGTKKNLFYKGYNKKKLSIQNSKKITFLKTQDTDPIKNLLFSFKLKYKNKKIVDDKKLILSTTKYLFKISESLKL